MDHDDDEHGDNEAHNNQNIRDDDGAEDRDYGYDAARDNGAGALQGSGSGVLSDGRPPPLNVGQDNLADPQAAAAANVPNQMPNAGDELDPIGKWAVILAKGYGTAQRWKVTAPGAAFPDAWCKQKVRDGFYITAVGGRGGKHKPSQQWVVVCTKGIMPGGAQSWRWTGWGDGFPNEWAQKKYDAGLRLTTVGCTAGRWCVVMSTPPKGAKVKQWWAWRDSWANLFEWIKPKLVKGSCVTELAATGKHCFACVTHTENTEKLKYFWKYDATFPSKDLVTKCDNGYVVECLAGGMGKWAIAAHSGAWTNVHQRWLYNADSFDKFYEKHKDEGFRILAIDGMKG